MTAWWQGLADRERLLIQVAAGLTGVILLWQFMLNPVMNARADARIELAQLDQDLSRLQEAYVAKRARGTVQFLPEIQSEYTGDAFKMAVTRSASERGLSISRLQGQDETIGLVFESADPRFIFFWLEDVETRLGGQVNRLVMEQSGGGLVRARVDLRAANKEASR